MRSKLIILFVIVSSLSAYCQRISARTQKPATPDTTTEKSSTVNHYLGVQGNQLLRQILNFGNSTGITNPYLLVYSVNSKKTGWGFSAGLGYQVNSSTAEPTSGFEQSVSSHSFQLRLGAEKKVMLSRKWMVHYAFDVLIGNDGDEEKTISSFDGTQQTTKNTTTSFGLGPRAGLNFFITNRIIVGTESTYYDKWSTVKQSFGGTTDDSKTKQNNLLFSLPVVLFLIVKI